MLVRNFMTIFGFKLCDAENQTDFETTLQIEEIKPKTQPLPIIPKFYELFIYIDHDSPELKDLYVNSVYKHNQVVEKYLTAITNNETNMEQYCFNAGFDLFCPEDTESIGAQKVVLDHKIVTCMKHKNVYVSYYLYSRSSTPMKTPLRLANSVGLLTLVIGVILRLFLTIKMIMILWNLILNLVRD